MMLWQGMSPVMTGFALGLASAVLSGRLLGSELFGISPHDPMTISAVTILLMTVAFLACLIPARRAACIDPVRALRFE
jgi:putative ABC transport system permease protein